MLVQIALASGTSALLQDGLSALGLIGTHFGYPANASFDYVVNGKSSFWSTAIALFHTNGPISAVK